VALHGSLLAAKTQVGLARHRLDSLLAQNPNVALGDAVGRVLLADSLRLATCEATTANCELRAQNAEARVRGDSTQLLRLTALTDTLEVAWNTARRQNSPGFLGLRAFWKARSYTLPLTALSAFLLISRR